MEGNYGVDERFERLEKQVATIFERLDKDSEKSVNIESRHADFYEILTKINSLEREKRDLKEENFALRQEIVDLKEILGKKLTGENCEKQDKNTTYVNKNNFIIPSTFLFNTFTNV